MTAEPGGASNPPYRALFDRPVFIVSTPRSGSTLLFDTLAQAPRLFTIGQESHWVIEDTADFDPEKRGWSSNRLTAADAKAGAVEDLCRAFYRDLRDRDDAPASGAVRMLEKTPKNALRVPFFAGAFPDSSFVYLYRNVREVLASMMEAWASGGFRTYPQLPGWTGYPWSMLLVPGWRELIGQPLPVIVARQWAMTTQILLDDLEALAAERVHAVTYQALIDGPQAQMQRLTANLGLDWDRTLGSTLPLSKVTVSPPQAGKWRRLEREIEALIPIVAAADARARDFASTRA
ncbi:MAG: sulfotransferase [Sphingomonas sp.]|nr:sulfotransferase [Sphingomonas sp.]